MIYVFPWGITGISNNPPHPGELKMADFHFLRNLVKYPRHIFENGPKKVEFWVFGLSKIFIFHYVYKGFSTWRFRNSEMKKLHWFLMILRSFFRKWLENHQNSSGFIRYFWSLFRMLQNHVFPLVFWWFWGGCQKRLLFKIIVFLHFRIFGLLRKYFELAWKYLCKSVSAFAISEM